MVAAIKATVKHLHQHGNVLNYAEMQYLYNKCCDANNDVSFSLADWCQLLIGQLILAAH